MREKAIWGTMGLFVLLLALVSGLSGISNRLWGGKPEKLTEPAELTIRRDMTVAGFGEVNNLPNPF